MHTEAQKRCHRAWLEGWLGRREAHGFERWFTASHVLHQSIVRGLGPGIPSLEEAARLALATFSRSFVQIEDQVAEGDRCMTRFDAQAKQVGPIGAMRPSGAWVSIRAMVISRFSGGKIEETWLTVNDLDVLTQIDAAALLCAEEVKST